ncbi:hypothetical protein SNEBB_001648 [Seison nebaliae]|nr:hypothetical protein SNEBB_001648 [Seison nebaliae]
MDKYYSTIFPVDDFFNWLGYGLPDIFYLREFCIVISKEGTDGRFCRYQSYRNANEFRNQLKLLKPTRIEIGPIYSAPPSLHSRVESRKNSTKYISSKILIDNELFDTSLNQPFANDIMINLSNKLFVPIQRDFVIDIDLTDYDDVRFCCEDKAVCENCWWLANFAMKIIGNILKTVYDFHHLLWVFSGRRGIHCWVSDKKARIMSSEIRASIVEYIQLPKNKKKRISIRFPLPFHVEQIYNIMQESDVEDYLTKKQKILEDEIRWNKFLQFLPDNINQNELTENIFQKFEGSQDRWNNLWKFISKQMNMFELLKMEIILHYTYPRIDMNVSKGINHLLKAPFSIHPSTNKISVPIELDDHFNPIMAPTMESCVNDTNLLKPFLERFSQFCNDVKNDQNNS